MAPFRVEAGYIAAGWIAHMEIVDRLDLNKGLVLAARKLDLPGPPFAELVDKRRGQRAPLLQRLVHLAQAAFLPHIRLARDLIVLG